MKIAVIGSGISGLSLCYYLNNANYEITLFEKENKLGGHTNSYTVNSGVDEGLKIDTGFIVFNDRNYTQFLKIINSLKIPYDNSDMSFSYWNKDKQKGYSGKNLRGLLPNSVLDLGKIVLLKNIYLYTKKFKNDFVKGNLIKYSLHEYFEFNKFPKIVVEQYFLPLASAIWSSPTDDIGSWNAHFFAEFYMNHGLLDFTKRPLWKYIKNGSTTYIDYIIKHTKPNIKLNTYIKGIQPFDSKVKILTTDDEMLFDKVFVSTHADQAYSLLSTNNIKIHYKELKHWRYSNNQIFLHKDTNLLPPKKYWASWNYLEDSNNDSKKVSISYYMNYLNRIRSNNNYIVSLNPLDEPKSNQILYETYYQHPVFDKIALDSRENIKNKNGGFNIYFTGSYLGNGFHEDGVKSSYQAYKKFINSDLKNEF
tara:strand:- start:7224 stop:8486 length:1263 start_codon:yes stop_codon:yes gene_type:complete